MVELLYTAYISIDHAHTMRYFSAKAGRGYMDVPLLHSLLLLKITNKFSTQTLIRGSSNKV